MRTKREPVPYANATSGTAAREEIGRMLRRFGCESVGFMDDYRKYEVILYFDHRGRRVQMRASAQGWAAMFIRAKPWRSPRSGTKMDYERKALAQGLVAVNSILRDWLKGQLTAVECGMMGFEAVFLPHVMLPDGRSMIEHVTAAKMLPAPRG